MNFEMRCTALAAALCTISGATYAQQAIPQPTQSYYNGVVLSDNFRKGALYVPTNTTVELSRTELDVTVAPGGSFMVDNDLTACHTQGAGSTCYRDIHLTTGTGPGLINGDYRRVEHYGTGPSIARKTAVRGSPSQWAVWGEQINMGPGAKAAIWIGGDNPQLENRRADIVPNIIVVNNNLDVTNSVFQWNASTQSTGVFLRVFKGQKLVFEVTSDGVVRAKGFQWIP